MILSSSPHDMIWYDITSLLYLFGIMKITDTARWTTKYFYPCYWLSVNLVRITWEPSSFSSSSSSLSESSLECGVPPEDWKVTLLIFSHCNRTICGLPNSSITVWVSTCVDRLCPVIVNCKSSLQAAQAVIETNVNTRLENSVRNDASPLK